MRWSQSNLCNPVWVILDILVSYFGKSEVNMK